jgi:hypothetical protein
MQAIQGAGAYTPAVAAQLQLAGAPELRMLVVMVQNQLMQGEVAKSEIDLGADQLKELREQVRAALEEARKAEEDSGFFGFIGDLLGGDLATLAQVVAVAAAAIVTAGTAAVVLATIAIACTLASKYGKELGLPPGVAMGLGIAAAVSMVAAGNVGGLTGATSAASAAGSGAASAGAAAGSVAPGVALGASVSSGGLAATATAASKVTVLTEWARDIGFVAGIVAPAASGAGAGAHVVSGYYRGDAIEHDADARQAQSLKELVHMDMDAALDVFERAVDRQLSVVSLTQEVLDANQQSNQLIIERVA